MQNWSQIDQFMEFTKTTGMMWAKSAGCNQIRAIFATGRAPRVYKSTEFEVNGVHISFTVYAKTANQGFSIQTILGFLPASCASDRDALTVDQTPRRGQIQFNELQKHSCETGCAAASAQKRCSRLWHPALAVVVKVHVHVHFVEACSNWRNCKASCPCR